MKFLNILCLLAISFSLPAQQINWDNSKTPLIPIEIKESVEAEIHDYLSEFDLLTQQAFVLSAYEVAKSGWHHITLDHIVDDIPVFGEKIKIHLDVGKEIRFLSGIPSKIQAHENVNILNQQQVEEIALNHFESVSGNVISSNQRELHLTYYEDVLCYYMSLQSPQSETGFQYFINATTGKIINTISTIHHVAVPGTGKSRYYGIVDITIDSIMPDSFVLRDPTRTLDGLTIGFFDDNKITSQTSHFDLDSTQNLDAAIDIMYGVSKVYDLLRDSFDWFSYNNLDESFSIVMIPNLSNASWYPDHGLAAFGLGGCPLGPFTTVDIIGHELMHGVIEHSSDLFYWGESGGINESLATQ